MIFKTYIYLIIILIGTPLFAITQDNIENKVKNITNKILKDEKYYQSFDKKLKKLTDKIKTNRVLLSDRYKQKSLLEKDLEVLNSKQTIIESRIISLVIKKYSKSIAIKHTNQKYSKSIINNEAYKILQKAIQEEMEQYNKYSELILTKISKNKSFIDEIDNIQKKQEKLILDNKRMKLNQATNIKMLRQEYIKHIDELKKINNVDSQNIN